MMLKVSGLPPEMTTSALRMLIQDSCNLSYVMVEELQFQQRDSSPGQSAIVACPDDNTGARVLQKLHGMSIGPYQLSVESLGLHGLPEAPQVFGIQKDLENVQNFLQAAEELLKVAPKILEIVKSQSFQNSPLLMPGAQTNKELSLAPRVAQTTYQIAKQVQEIQSTQHMAYQNHNRLGSSHSAFQSDTTMQSQPTTKIHGMTTSFQTNHDKNSAMSTDKFTVVNRAVDRVLYNLLNSKPILRISDKLEDQYANENYKSIVENLKCKIRYRLNDIQSLHQLNIEKELYEIYCMQHPEDIKGHLSGIGTGKKAILGTAKKKLMVDCMLIETPWAQPSEVSATPAQRQQYNRRQRLNNASNLICLCVLNMPRKPAKHDSMPKLESPDRTVFTYFKVDIFKKLDAFCDGSHIRTLIPKRVAPAFLFQNGTEINKSLEDAITFCEKESGGKCYQGIFKRDSIKPKYRMFITDKEVKRRVVSISRQILRQNTEIIDELKQSFADKEKYGELMYERIQWIVTKRIQDMKSHLTTFSLLDQYWERHPNTREVCMMADEQLKSGGNKNTPSETETFTSSIDEFISEISEMIDSDA